MMLLPTRLWPKSSAKVIPPLYQLDALNEFGAYVGRFYADEKPEPERSPGIAVVAHRITPSSEAMETKQIAMLPYVIRQLRADPDNTGPVLKERVGLLIDSFDLFTFLAEAGVLELCHPGYDPMTDNGDFPPANPANFPNTDGLRVQ